VFGELQERTQRGEAQVAAVHRIAAPLLQIIEEGQEQVRGAALSRWPHWWSNVTV